MAAQDSAPTAPLVLRSEADGTLTPLVGEVTVGRTEDSVLSIKQASISRKHARLFEQGGGWMIEDPGSSNGTYVNGLRITTAVPIKARDSLSFDSYLYTVVSTAPEPPPAAPVDRDRTVVGMRPVPAEPDPARAPAPPPSAPVSPAVAAKPAAAPAPLAPDAPGAAPRAEQFAPPPVVASGPRVPRDAVAEPTTAPSDAPEADEIPASWAEAGQLEQRSHTMMLSVGLLRALQNPVKGTSGIIAAVRAERRSPLPYLIGINHKQVGLVFPLDPAKNPPNWEIGRDADSDIVLADESVSGRHAQVVYENGRWKVVNLMSFNGTFVNGRKVLSAHLSSGDKVRLGNIELAFDAGGKLPPAPRVEDGGAEGGWWARLWARIAGLFRRG